MDSNIAVCFRHGADTWRDSVIAFIFTFYILVFLIDLLPATCEKRNRHRPMAQTDAEMNGAGGSTEPVPMATADARLQYQANDHYARGERPLRGDRFSAAGPPDRYVTPVDGVRPSAAQNF